MLDNGAVLEAARVETGLSHGELWFRYFAVGGMSAALEVEACLYGVLDLSKDDRDLLALALNERYSELGGDHPLPYSEDAGPPE